MIHGFRDVMIMIHFVLVHILVVLMSSECLPECRYTSTRYSLMELFHTLKTLPRLVVLDGRYLET